MRDLRASGSMGGRGQPGPPRLASQVVSKPPSSLDAAVQVQAALGQLGFGQSQASAVVGRVLDREPGLDAEQLSRTCLQWLVPAAS